MDIFQPSFSLKELYLKTKGFSSHKRKENSVSTHDYKPREMERGTDEHISSTKVCVFSWKTAYKSTNGSFQGGNFQGKTVSLSWETGLVSWVLSLPAGEPELHGQSPSKKPSVVVQDCNPGEVEAGGTWGSLAGQPNLKGVPN